MSVTGSVVSSTNSVINIDVASTSSNDLLNVSGDFDSSLGKVQLDFGAGHGFTGGETFSIINYGTNTGGAFALADIQHNLGAGYTLSSTDNTGATTIDINVSSSFDKTFISGTDFGNRCWSNI